MPQREAQTRKTASPNRRVNVTTLCTPPMIINFAPENKFFGLAGYKLARCSKVNMERLALRRHEKHLLNHALIQDMLLSAIGVQKEQGVSVRVNNQSIRTDIVCQNAVGEGLGFAVG